MKIPIPKPYIYKPTIAEAVKIRFQKSIDMEKGKNAAIKYLAARPAIEKSIANTAKYNKALKLIEYWKKQKL